MYNDEEFNNLVIIGSNIRKCKDCKVSFYRGVQTKDISLLKEAIRQCSDSVCRHFDLTYWINNGYQVTEVGVQNNNGEYEFFIVDGGDEYIIICPAFMEDVVSLRRYHG